MYKAVLILAIGLVVSAGADAGMYKWTDAQGNVHYGERPPPGMESEKMGVPPSPKGADVDSSRDRWDNILERQQRADELRREDKERKQQEKAEQQQHEANRKKACAAAHYDLEVLRAQVPVYEYDDKGERVYFDEETRAGEIARLEQFIAEQCR